MVRLDLYDTVFSGTRAGAARLTTAATVTLSFCCVSAAVTAWRMHGAVAGALSGSGKTGVGTVSGVAEANRGSGAGLEKPGFST